MGTIRKSLITVVVSTVFVFCVHAQNDPSAAAVPSKSAPAKVTTVKDTVKPSVSKSTAGSTTAKTVVAKTTASAGDTLVVKARVLEIPGKFPPNDLYNYVYVMKYKIISVEKGKYDGEEILVGHYNPLIPRKQLKDKMAPFIKGDVEKFEVGAKHHLYLITPVSKIWKDATEDDYIDSDLPKYIAVKAELAK
jgi:hypothetical protein